MAIATFLQASDTHDRGDLLDLEAVVNLANEKKPDGVILPGDLFDAGVTIGVIEDAKQLVKEAEKTGDKENAKKLFNESIMVLIQYFLTASNMLKQSKHKYLGVLGNHDPNDVHQMQGIHWLDKDGPVEIKGLKIAGAQNMPETEIIQEFPKELYAGRERDKYISDIEKFIKETGTKEDLDNFRKSNPVYQRLVKETKEKTADILVAHTGIEKLALEERKDGQKIDWTYGAGLALWVKDKTLKKEPLIMLSGHVHPQPLYVKEHGYQGLRSSNEYAYIIHVNTETKQIEKIEVYQKVYEKVSKKEYEANRKKYDAAQKPKKN